ncbi:hypothetical protein Tco_0692016 [Tanacetum coccineum]
MKKDANCTAISKDVNAASWIKAFTTAIDFETDFPAIVYNDASTSNQNVSSRPTVCIYNAIKSDIDFSISYFNSEDEDYTFIYDKDSLSHKLIPVNDLKSESVNDHVEINTELCSKNIDIKPMNSIVCIILNTAYSGLLDTAYRTLLELKIEVVRVLTFWNYCVHAVRARIQMTLDTRSCS